MTRFGILPLEELVSFLARTSTVRIVSHHGVEILYEGKAGELKDQLSIPSPPKRQGREAVANWQYIQGLVGRQVLYGQEVELAVEDWVMEFVSEAERDAFLMKHKGETFSYLFLEVSDVLED